MLVSVWFVILQIRCTTSTVTSETFTSSAGTSIRSWASSGWIQRKQQLPWNIRCGGEEEVDFFLVFTLFLLMLYVFDAYLINWLIDWLIAVNVDNMDMCLWVGILKRGYINIPLHYMDPICKLGSISSTCDFAVRSNDSLNERLVIMCFQYLLQAFILKFLEIGKVLFSLSVIDSSQGQQASHSVYLSSRYNFI